MVAEQAELRRPRDPEEMPLERGDQRCIGVLIFVDEQDREAAGQHRAELGVIEQLDEHRKNVIMVERSEEHTSELQSLMRISYAVFCLKKKKRNNHKLPNL